MCCGGRGALPPSSVRDASFCKPARRVPLDCAVTALSNRRYVVLYCLIARSTPQPAAAPKARGHVHVYWAQEAGHREGGSLQHLYAAITAVAHDDAALAVDQDAVGRRELPISTALAADGSHVAAVTVA
jgi:hypothetical protein